MLTIAGIDASISGTGVCVISPEGTFFYTFRGSKLATKPSDVEKNQRLALLVRDILNVIKHLKQ
jgi:Holliday junction resolvasome RuvABC endonuclease subunit